jgi:hypothetical protein
VGKSSQIQYFTNCGALAGAPWADVDVGIFAKHDFNSKSLLARLRRVDDLWR